MLINPSVFPSLYLLLIGDKNTHMLAYTQLFSSMFTLTYKLLSAPWCDCGGRLPAHPCPQKDPNVGFVQVCLSARGPAFKLYQMYGSRQTSLGKCCFTVSLNCNIF